MKDYENTYATIEKIYNEINKHNINAYIIGGISSAIQANIDLYRPNEDIDLMVEKKDLEKLMQCLSKIGYKVEDKRRNLTRNYIDENDVFHPKDHELNAYIDNSNMLGVGIFLFERKDRMVITNSYIYDEIQKCVVDKQNVMPEELFNLMYSSQKISYKGIDVKCQSKEYTYLSKSRGTREKDKKDASVIEKYIGEDERKIIQRINILQKRIQEYEILYDKEGNIISSKILPSIEDKIEKFISTIVSNTNGMTSEQIKEIVLNNETVKKFMEQDKDINNIMNLWKDSQVEGDIVKDAKDIAHEYYYNDKSYVILTNSLGKISVNIPISEADRQEQQVNRKVYERRHQQEKYDSETSYPSNSGNGLREN